MSHDGFDIRLRLKELGVYARGSYRKDVQRYAILAHYRSGSTLLSELLDDHPQVSCAGEVLVPHLHVRPRWVMAPHAYVRARASATAAPIGGVILRLDQLHWVRIPLLHRRPIPFLDRLASEGWTFIHLVRQNALRQALSNVKALTLESWHVYEGDEVKQGPVRIDVKKLLHNVRWAETTRAAEAEVLADKPHMQVEYERDLLDPARRQSVMDDVFRFLGADPMPVSTRLRKGATRSIEETVANLDELLDALHATPFERYLPERLRSA